MSIKIGVVMDDIRYIKSYKDSSFAMLLAAQARGWELFYMEQGDLSLRSGEPHGRVRQLRVVDQKQDYFSWVGDTAVVPLTQLDAILIRTDPPIDLEYIYATHILEQAEQRGVLVVNKPQSLRDANEKLYTAWFPQATPPTLVTKQMSDIHDFLATHGDIIIKPLDMMGGSSIFRLREGDPNLNVIMEVMTQKNKQFITAQRYLPAIAETGDKRILLIDGEPVPYALARMLPPGETRANMAVGGKGIGVPLTERDRWLCAQVAPTLKEKGFLFVGLDVIGDYITEINVTSPTGMRELDAEFGLDTAGLLMDAIARQLA